MNRYQILRHLVGEPTHIALRTSAGCWLPSPVTADEIEGLLAAHMVGDLVPTRPVVRRDRDERTLVMEHTARWCGAYAINHDEDGKPLARWICIDTDVKANGHKRGLTQEQADALATIITEIATDAGLCPMVERSHSGLGWHVWILFPEPVPGPMAEWLGSLIAVAAAKRAGLPDGAKPESFPKNGDPDGLGSLVALPFTGAPRGEGGGQVSTPLVQLVPVSVVAEWHRQWIAAAAAAENLKQEQTRAAEERKQKWKASGKTGALDFDRIDCETVARTIAPERITDEDDGELYLDCPRHASGSRRSLTVSRERGGWFCFGCAKGGGSLLLARWLMPEGTDYKTMCKALERVAEAV